MDHSPLTQSLHLRGFQHRLQTRRCTKKLYSWVWYIGIIGKLMTRGFHKCPWLFRRGGCSFA
jgi:hypothetical protein